MIITTVSYLNVNFLKSHDQQVFTFPHKVKQIVKILQIKSEILIFVQKSENSVCGGWISV